jgi:hypothetical protein
MLRFGRPIANRPQIHNLPHKGCAGGFATKTFKRPSCWDARGVYSAHQGNYYGPAFCWFAPYRVKAVDLGRFDGAPGNSRKRTFQKGRNIMSKKTKKVEKIEQEKKEVKPAELPEQELDKVAGGATYSTTKSNIKTQ